MFAALARRSGGVAVRSGLASSAGASKEAAMEALLTKELKATAVKVDDISGGCGSMYSITVESPLFRGVSLVKQHQMVKGALKKEIADMHGLTLQTKVSKA